MRHNCGLPFVRDRNGRATVFNFEKFRSALAYAASLAGYQECWLVDSLVAGISHYLRYGCASGVIDLSKLDEMVQSMLWSVGYQEIASHFQTSGPCHSISLLHCVRNTTSNDRAGFFRYLAEQINNMRAANARGVHFSDLQACVRELQRMPPSHRTADDESYLSTVVSFIREQFQSLWRSEQTWCYIS